MPKPTATRYPTDLTDEQYQLIREFVEPPGFEPALKHSRREIVNAILYLNRTGCGWEYFPTDLPPWKTVYGYYRAWTRDGTWQCLHDALREQVRREAGKRAQPTAAIIDAQSVKTTEKGGSVATMPAKRSRVASAISSSTRSG